jgi:glycosyltransferase 2 family protein
MFTITVNRLLPLYARITTLLQPYRQWLIRGLQGVIVLASLAYLSYNARQLQQHGATLHLDAGYLSLSALLTLLALWLGAIAWGFLLRSGGIHVPWPRVAWIHLSSNLAKYLPGYGWQLVGKAFMSRQAGVSTGTLSVLMISELLLILMSGAVIGAVVVYGYDVVPNALWRRLILVGGCAAAGLILLLPSILPFLCQRVWNHPLRFSKLTYAYAVMAMAAGWLAFGLAFWLLGASLTKVLPGTLPNFIFAIVGSFWVSLIVLVVPAGIGVRESIIVLLLGPVIGPSPAVVIAIVSRLVWLGSEFLAAWTARLWLQNSRPA